MQEPNGNPGESSACCHKMRTSLWELQQRGEFCDLVLETKAGDRVLTHRVVVASCSPVLYNMILNTYLERTDCSQVLSLPDVSIESLQEMVRLVYLGHLERVGDETLALCERFQLSESLLSDKENPRTRKTPEIKEEETSAEIKREGPGEKEEVEKSKSLETRAERPPSPRIRSCSKRKGKHPKRRKLQEPVPTPPPLPPVETDSLEDIPDISSPEDDDRDPLWDDTPRRKRPQRTPTKTEPPIPKEPPRRGRGRGKGRGRGRGRGKTDLVPKIKPGKVVTKIESNTVSAKKTCGTCSLDFPTLLLYKKHREKMHRAKEHKCDECDRSFKRPKQLKAHKVKCHYKEGLTQPSWYTCTELGCKYKTIYRHSLDVHYRHIHTKDKTICETCGGLYSSPGGLKLHIERVHGGTDASHECDVCHKNFPILRDLQAHKSRVHDKVRNYLCDQCPYMAYDKTSVAHHMFSHHQVPLPGKATGFSCPHCDFKCPVKSHMVTHMERHEPKTHRCEFCDSVFSASRNLKEHIKLTHGAGKRVTHKCPYEGCKFESKYGPRRLKDHISRMHERRDFKPFGCNDCDYRTNVKGNLTIHLRNVHGQPVTSNRRQLIKVRPEGASPIVLPKSQNEDYRGPRQTVDLLSIQQEAAIKSAIQQVTGMGSDLQQATGLGSGIEDKSGIHSDMEPRGGIQSMGEAHSDIRPSTEIRSHTQLMSKIHSDVQSRTEIRSDIQSMSQIHSNAQSRTEIRSDIQSMSEIRSDIQSMSEIRSNVQSRTEIHSDIQSTREIRSDVHASGMHTSLQTGIHSNIQPPSEIRSDIQPTSGIRSDIQPTSGIRSDIQPTSGIHSDIHQVSGATPTILSPHTTSYSQKDMDSTLPNISSMRSSLPHLASMNPDIQRLSSQMATDMPRMPGLSRNIHHLTSVASDMQRLTGVSPDFQRIPAMSSDAQRIPDAHRMSHLNSDMPQVTHGGSDLQTLTSVNSDSRRGTEMTSTLHGMCEVGSNNMQPCFPVTYQPQPVQESAHSQQTSSANIPMAED